MLITRRPAKCIFRGNPLKKALLIAGMACLALAAALAPAPAEAQTWNVTTGTWGTAGSWDGGVPATTGTAYFSSSGVLSDATAVMGATTTIGGLVFQSSGIQTTLVGSANNRILNIGSGGITVGSSSGNVIIGVTGTLVTQQLTVLQTWTNNSTTGTLFMNGARNTTGATSPVTLTIAGDGRIEFNNSVASQGANALSIVTCPHGWNQCLSPGLPCQGIAPVRLLRLSRSKRTCVGHG